MKVRDAKRALCTAAVAAAVLVSHPAVGAMCDAGLSIADTDPAHGAEAIDLCTVSDGSSPGLVSAAYGNSDFSNSLSSLTNGLAGVGLLASFGPNVVPQAGARMLALSTGAARSPSDPGYQAPTIGFSKGFSSQAPPGFPGLVGLCATPPANVFDSAALRVALVAPAWAHSYHFDFKFYSSDYPNFVCSSYNDQFLVMESPAPVGSLSGDIAFDANVSPITVNSAGLVLECTPGTYACPLGAAELAGTGFEGGAATPWLRTIAPIGAGATVTLTFLLFDSSDGSYDSTALIDAFGWSPASAEGPSTQIAVPEPDGAQAAAAALFTLVLAERRRRARPFLPFQPQEIRTP